MVQQKRELSLGRGGKDIQPTPLSRALRSPWLEHRTLPTDSNSLWMCPTECGQEEEHVSGWPGWLPDPAAFSVPGSISPASSLLAPRESSSIN